LLPRLLLQNSAHAANSAWLRRSLTFVGIMNQRNRQPRRGGTFTGSCRHFSTAKCTDRSRGCLREKNIPKWRRSTQRFFKNPSPLSRVHRIKQHIIRGEVTSPARAFLFPGVEFKEYPYV